MRSNVTITLIAVGLLVGMAMTEHGLTAADGNASGTSAADKQTFDAVVSPFLEKYCVSCHGEKKDKGDIRLHQMHYDLASSRDLDKWQVVFKQLQINEMPPEDKPQPAPQVKQRVMEWIDKELAKSGNPNSFHEMMQKPHYGNYVSHEKLFSGEVKEEAFSPARLWRRSPYHFEQAKTTFFGGQRDSHKVVGEVEKLKQPFQKGDGEGINDYAALLYADSATFDTLYRNAEFTVDRTLLMAFIEMDYKSEGKTMEDWKADRAKVIQAQQAQMEAIKGTGETRYLGRAHNEINKKYGMATPQVYKDIILSVSKPSQAMMEAAVKHHFNRVLQWDPAEEDLRKFTKFMADGIEKSGPYFGLRNALIAVMVSPRFIYRSELGLGKAIGDGRTMLSPVELAYAIAYALTDKDPDEKLIAAVKDGRLTTREDVKREVVRMLADDSIDKPRTLRFFHEFFGYHRAPQVFKDDTRFFKGYTFFTIANRYVGDTDALVRHILKNDQDVLKELLTTDKFFVLHSGENEEHKKEVEAHKRLYAYFKEKNWRNYAKNAKNQEEPTADEVKFAMSLHPEFKGSLKNGEAIYNKMKQLEPFEKKGMVPATYSEKRTTDAVFDGLAAYNLPGRDWNFAVEQPFVLAKGKRAGILSHPSWLIAHSLNTTTDPVRRGKWIRNFLLADNIPDVPITVDATVPEDHHKTLRERYSVTEAPDCLKCHTLMNPLGYPFEIFDDFGRWRSEETMEGLPLVEKKHQTKPVNSKGYLSGTGDAKLDGEVADAIDLVHRLAQSRRVQQSFIRHVFRYYMGRNEMLTDSKTLIQAESEYVSKGGSFKALLISLLTSDSFIYRKNI